MSIFSDAVTTIQKEFQSQEQKILVLQTSLDTANLSIANLNKSISEKDAAIALLNAQIVAKDAEIAKLKAQLPKFKLFDSTATKVLGTGFEPVVLLTESNFYPTETRGPVDLAWFKTVSLPKIKTRHPNAKRFVIDLEWFFSNGVTAQEVQYYVDVVKTMKEFDSTWIIGAYGCPLRSQSHLAGDVEAETKAWLDAQVAFKPLLALVDFGAISVYALTSNEDLFVRYVKSNIDMWKTFSTKPVYPYFWPEYHRNAKRSDGTTLQGVAIPASLMRKALDACYENADGITIWHFAAYRLDTTAAWWLELNKWRKEKGL